MKIEFKLFGYTVVLSANKNDAESHVLAIINDELKKVDASKISKKIFIIKILRREEVSKILIDTGVVPLDDIRGEVGHEFLSIAWAKTWAETRFKFD